ncbi:hypothetical protein P4646_23355 [Peribacillus simplex]|nr:hypothetical protein [Peribacillus simplex]MED4094238.1 hypothetical protein [Peribacillus simplex]
MKFSGQKAEEPANETVAAVDTPQSSVTKHTELDSTTKTETAKYKQ